MYQAIPKATPPANQPQAIHHEWRTAQNSAAYLLPTLLSLRESNPNLSLLDVGAGSGTISITFAQLIPEGTVTATDINPSILARASALASSENVPNIDFKEADAYHLPFPDESFDITHCHQVLAHLAKPCEMLKEMMRVTKKGGVIAAREGDLDTECVWPALDGLVKFHGLAVGLMKAGGGYSDAGRRLVFWALEAGARREQVTGTFGAWCYTEKRDKEAWAQGIIKMVEGGRAREVALKAGLATEIDLKEMRKGWQEWQEMDESTLGMMHGEILIRK